MNARYRQHPRMGILTALFVAALLLGTVAAFTLLLPASAEAQGVPETYREPDPACQGLVYCAMTKVIEWAIRVFVGGITKFIGTLIAVAASIMQTMIEVNSKALGSEILRVGFRITLNLANLGFVLAIILIAFGTILRYEQYHLKKTFVKLIAAALLVNFSLLIVGVILDFTNILANSFFARSTDTGTRETFSEGLAQTLSLSKFQEVKPDAGKFEGAFTEIARLLVGVLTSLLFAVIILIVFIAIMFMIMVRYIYIVFLVIMMPIAWLFWVIPNLSHLTQQWWSTFLKWAFFLPAVAFFLYLVVFTQAKTKHFTNEVVNPPGEAANHSLFSKDGIASFLDIFVLAGLLVGGLYAAQKMSITGAGAAIGVASNVGKMGAHFATGGLAYRNVAAGTRTGRIMKKFAKDVVRTPGFLIKTAKSVAAAPFKAGGRMSEKRRLAQEKSADQMVSDFRAGKTSYEDIRSKVKDKQPRLFQPERKEHDTSLLALAKLESGGKITPPLDESRLLGGLAAEEQERATVTLSEKEMKSIQNRRQQAAVRTRLERALQEPGRAAKETMGELAEKAKAGAAKMTARVVPESLAKGVGSVAGRVGKLDELEPIKTTTEFLNEAGEELGKAFMEGMTGKRAAPPEPPKGAGGAVPPAGAGGAPQGGGPGGVVITGGAVVTGGATITGGPKKGIVEKVQDVLGKGEKAKIPLASGFGQILREMRGKKDDGQKEAEEALRHAGTEAELKKLKKQVEGLESESKPEPGGAKGPEEKAE